MLVDVLAGAATLIVAGTVQLALRLPPLLRGGVVIGAALLVGWFIRGAWDSRYTWDSVSAECKALATYSAPGLRIGPYQPVRRAVDHDQWASCMRGKGFEPAR